MEYIRVMADDTDPEYENMKAWAESQGERKQSPEEINSRLNALHRLIWIFAFVAIKMFC